MQKRPPRYLRGPKEKQTFPIYLGLSNLSVVSANAVGNQTPERPAEERCDGTPEHFEVARRDQGVEAVNGTNKSNERVQASLGRIHASFAHNHTNGSHGQDVRHDVGHNGQVNAHVELLEQFGAARH